MDIKTYIDKQAKTSTNGEAIRALAKTLNCTPRAVEAWYYGHRRPRKEMAKVIIQKTPITLAGLYL